ncbi:actin-related protein 2/3 complex subunit 1A-like [Sycon ciliatum]|uniref:actin-related protein 2/3 complex subunit 1A-like n=1 Tax=Sycon ciliatum TaxID=27933 RepID=UPI0031F6BEBE
MPEVLDLCDQVPIACHAWNGDRTQIALSPNSTEVNIYQKVGKTFELKHVLKGHGQRVRGVDWAPKSNQIVTCGDDRNAYVWTQQDDGTWKPMLVLLRINRAATCVKWSPNESKFAVGCGARLISVCYFEKEQNWWVSKHIKKPIQSTVLSLDWHPNNCLLVAGSADFKCRVYSGYVKEIEDKPTPTSWGKKMPFGNLMAEFANGRGGWVHSVSFSPNGEKVCWVGHNSSITVADSASDNQITVVEGNHLPLLSVTFLSDKSILAAGHDCSPMLFDVSGTDIKFKKRLDEAGPKKAAGGVSAMDKFRNMDAKGTDSKTQGTVLTTTHQNAISAIVIHTGDKASGVKKISTSGNDGLLVTWDV